MEVREVLENNLVALSKAFNGKRAVLLQSMAWDSLADAGVVMYEEMLEDGIAYLDEYDDIIIRQGTEFTFKTVLYRQHNTGVLTMDAYMNVGVNFMQMLPISLEQLASMNAELI